MDTRHAPFPPLRSTPSLHRLRGMSVFVCAGVLLVFAAISLLHIAQWAQITPVRGERGIVAQRCTQDAALPSPAFCANDVQSCPFVPAGLCSAQTQADFRRPVAPLVALFGILITAPAPPSVRSVHGAASWGRSAAQGRATLQIFRC